MNRNGLTAWLFLSTAILAGETHAEPVLLASLENRVFRPAAAPADPEASIVLELNDSQQSALIGTHVLWRGGDVGSVDISAANDEAFSLFAELATDGIDGVLADGVWWGDGGTLFQGPESIVFGGVPDLTGFTLDFVRINVLDVSFEPWAAPSGMKGYRIDQKSTFEFFGHPVSEPSSILLIGCGLLFCESGSGWMWSAVDGVRKVTKFTPRRLMR